jgi:hypothetical protein
LAPELLLRVKLCERFEGVRPEHFQIFGLGAVKVAEGCDWQCGAEALQYALLLRREEILKRVELGVLPDLFVFHAANRPGALGRVPAGGVEGGRARHRQFLDRACGRVQMRLHGRVFYAGPARPTAPFAGASHVR